MEVVQIDKDVAKPFILQKHYSRRFPFFYRSYGLIENNALVGVIIYGMPPLPVSKHAFNDKTIKLYELSRLVIQTKTKNAASFLIANSLKLLDSPCAVVSYADTAYSHCGIVYQATNWHYTGGTVSHDHMYLVDGKQVHPRTLRDRGITAPKKWAKENGIETIKPKTKHRYFMFVGTKSERRHMKSQLKYPIITPYPKCDQNRYDDGDIIEMEWKGAI